MQLVGSGDYPLEVLATKKGWMKKKGSKTIGRTKFTKEEGRKKGKRDEDKKEETEKEEGGRQEE